MIKVKTVADTELIDGLQLLQDSQDVEQVLTDLGLEPDKYNYLWVEIKDGDYSLVYGGNYVSLNMPVYQLKSIYN